MSFCSSAAVRTNMLTGMSVRMGLTFTRVLQTTLIMEVPNAQTGHLAIKFPGRWYHKIYFDLTLRNQTENLQFKQKTVVFRLFISPLLSLDSVGFAVENLGNSEFEKYSIHTPCLAYFATIVWQDSYIHFFQN
jgi:hypothetical protein